jgi:hypothetical protein
MAPHIAFVYLWLGIFMYRVSIHVICNEETK